MKTPKFLSVCLLSFTLFFSCAGAKVTKGINDGNVPIGTERIIIHTKLSDEEAYKQASKILISNGYTISYSDKELNTFTTKPKGVSKRFGVDNVKNSITVYTHDNKIIISGTFYSIGDTGDDNQTIRKYGQNGSDFRNAWKAMWLLAEKFPEKERTFD